jgi:glycosyltransferase involved in cell wall biosynthesis
MPGGLRILHAIHDFLPRHQAGSELYAATLCQALAGRGHYPTVVCAEYDPARADGQITWRTHDGLPVAEVVNNWRVASFAESYRPRAVTTALTQLLDVVQPHVVHVHNLLNLSFDFPAAARARGIPVVATLHDFTLVCPSGGQRLHRAEQHRCDEIDPDRCARCFPDSPFYTQMQVARMTHRLAVPAMATAGVRQIRALMPTALDAVVRTVGRVGAPEITAAAIRARLTAARDVFDDVTLFVAPSAALAEEFAALGMDRGKLEVADIGFVPRERPPRRRPGQPLTLGFVGSLVWHKGPDVLVDAVRLLPQGSVQVEIIGDLDMFPDYVKDLRARAAGLPIRFRGQIPRQDVAELYGAMDVLVVPSRWMENSPQVIHEAFMAGVPVIGARLGGIPGLVTHDVSGLLVPPDSPPALAAAIRALLEEPGKLEALASQVPAVKSIDQDADEWIARYNRVRGGGATVPS